jgi:ribose 5-phosphate isomerase B
MLDFNHKNIKIGFTFLLRKKKMIYIGSDHGGFELKEEIIDFVENKLKKEIKDMGIYKNEPADYPDIAQTVCAEVLKNKATGILICGTGIGISITANKIGGIRCALCSEEYSARMSRMHNDANVLALGGRTLGPELAKSIVETFLSNEFQTLPRYELRIKKISDIEKNAVNTEYPKNKKD